MGIAVAMEPLMSLSPSAAVDESAAARLQGLFDPRR
jgi:hypothetical protein